VHSTPAVGTPAVTRASAVVVATGYFAWPNLLGVPGEDLPHVSHQFVEGHSAFGRDALVVGGGNSAVEASIELARCGARVTLVHYEDGFVSHVIKPWILPSFDSFVASGAIRTVWRARVREILAGEARLDIAGAAARVRADVVYLMTGYTPQPGLLGTLGIPFDPVTGAPAFNAATMETPLPGVFVCGVMAAGFKANGLFIENGRDHGPLIARALAQRR
jgi:thioredoxin reductase (NADPH)